MSANSPRVSRPSLHPQCFFEDCKNPPTTILFFLPFVRCKSVRLSGSVGVRFPGSGRQDCVAGLKRRATASMMSRYHLERAARSHGGPRKRPQRNATCGGPKSVMTECSQPTPPNHHHAFPSRGCGMKPSSKSLQGRNPRDVGRSAPAGARDFNAVLRMWLLMTRPAG
jgi:hypothetical protein